MDMDVVVTLLAAPKGAPLTEDHLAQARAALESLGGETARPLWLDPGRAADIRVDRLSPEQAEAAARQALRGLAVDVAAQPEAGRRKSLMVADMDSTIVEGETLDDLADHAGLKEVIARITAEAMNGDLDFRQALHKRVGMLHGLPLSALEETWAATRLSPGAKVAVRTMAAHGTRCVLVSGGFTFFTERVAAACGFHAHRGNILGVAKGRLTGRVDEPVVDKDTKLATLTAEAAALGVPLSQCLAVGDGANDLPMLLAAGLGVAYRAKPRVAAQARVCLDHADLTALLYLQGYKRDAFVED